MYTGFPTMLFEIVQDCGFLFEIITDCTVRMSLNPRIISPWDKKEGRTDAKFLLIGFPVIEQDPRIGTDAQPSKSYTDPPINRAGSHAPECCIPGRYEPAFLHRCDIHVMRECHHIWVS